MPKPWPLGKFWICGYNDSEVMSLSQDVKEFARSKGVIAVGIATIETLKGGPPSIELDYKLKGARSAIRPPR